MKRIVVATDGSEYATRAVDAAGELAAKLAARLSIIAVAPSPTTLAAELEPYARAEGLANDLPALLANIESPFLEPARQNARTHGIAELSTHTLAGDPAASIIEFARDNAIDLIVVGSRGHGRLGGLLLGSVSQKLATHAPCSVLIVR
jgi:nucleotide-binding universal stress UspA family protein